MASCMICGKSELAMQVICADYAAERLSDRQVHTIFERVRQASEEYRNTVDICEKAEAYIQYSTLYGLLLEIGLEEAYVLWREEAAEEV